MNMIERVAEGQANFDGRSLIAMPRGERERYYERAKIAIEAMREPTTKQLSAAQTAWLADPERKSSTIYRAMIDAALAEPNQ